MLVLEDSGSGNQDMYMFNNIDDNIPTCGTTCLTLS